MKKSIFILLIFLLVFSSFAFTNSNQINVNVNGQPLALDVQATMIDGRTVLPVRAIFESLGLTVAWDEATQTVIGSNDDTVIKLQINQTKASINGYDVILDVPAQVVDGRTLVPARFVAEATGAKVGWDEVTQTVSIDQKITKNKINFDGYTKLEVDGGELSGHREPSVVVDIGFGDREYYAFTNEYGQLVKVIANEIILQNDEIEPVLSTGRYYRDEAKVPGVESSTLDEGHVIADSLGGVANAYNITPQESTLNRHGDQAYMEKAIRDANGCTDFVAIITYPDTSTQIPSHYSFTYTLVNDVIHEEFDNVNPDEVNNVNGISDTSTVSPIIEDVTQDEVIKTTEMINTPNVSSDEKNIEDNSGREVTILYRLISNNHVGDEWGAGFSYDGEYYFGSNPLAVPSNVGTITIKAFAYESDDAKSDYGFVDFTINVNSAGVFRKEVVVIENGGRYTGNRAVVELTVIVE